MYQGSRTEMENFFKFAGYPTPALYNPADHYVTVVNDEFDNHDLSVDAWADKFIEYSRVLQGDEEEQSVFARAGRTASMLQVTHKEDIETERSRSPLVVFELTYRYFLNLWFNPGILGTRIVMYTMLALMVGALFWNLGDRTDFDSIQSRAAVLFYCVAFFVFMSVAVLPFTVIERAIVDKEVRNGYYHPSAYQMAQAISSIPGCALLALLTTVIIILMTGMNEPYWYFITMFLSLICAEALAQLVSHVVPHFVIGMAVIAGLYGFFMLFQGFLLLPSAFPSWLRWTYDIAFHTYAWRTFMYSEFADKDVIFEGPYQSGEEVLEAFEIADVDRDQDLVVLLCYGLAPHLLSFIVLHFKYTAFKGKIHSPERGGDTVRTG